MQIWVGVDTLFVHCLHFWEKCSKNTFRKSYNEVKQKLFLYLLYKMDIDNLREYLHSIKDDWNYITPIDFYNKYYLKKKDYFLVDLRSEKEYKKMHIKGSKNIFWLNILDEKNLKKLPKDKPIFLICYVGHTSSQVLTLLKMLGYNVISIKYGYGLSPIQGVPVAGWLDYGLPTESSK